MLAAKALDPGVRRDERWGSEASEKARRFRRASRVVDVEAYSRSTVNPRAFSMSMRLS